MPSVGEQTAQGFREAFSGTGARDPGVEYCGHLIADVRKVIAAGAAVNVAAVVDETVAAQELGPVVRRLAGAVRTAGGPVGEAAAPGFAALLHWVL